MSLCMLPLKSHCYSQQYRAYQESKGKVYEEGFLKRSYHTGVVLFLRDGNESPMMCNSSSIFGFRRQLKTFLYKSAFEASTLRSAPPTYTQRLRFGGSPPTLRAL